MNKSLLPTIRFKESINENNFQKVKLKTITTIWGGSTPSTKNKKLWLNEIPFITPNFITKNNSMLLNKYDRFITDKNFNFSKKNDILLTCRAPVGVVTINNLEKCWFSQGIKNIRTGKLINHKYLYYWLYKNKNVLITNSFGTTFLEISNKDLENIQIYITCSLQEQTKIAQFFTIIDRKIELIKAQLSLLEKQKQYYLNNMFANEKGYPKIRFKGFNDEWVLKQIQEVLITIKSLKIKKNFESNTKLPLISQKKDFIDLYIKKGNLVEQLPIILFGDHTTILKYIDKSFFVADDGIKLLELSNSFKNFNLKFVYYSALLNNVSQSGYKRHFLILKNVFISLTNNINEQTKVAHFFTIIDRKIELIKAQLSLLEKQKQYYLNNMFI